jgi:tetratricopeptide (TPR) repeat protein
LQKRYDEAIIYLERAVEVFPFDAHHHHLLGKAYEGKNMKSKVEKEFNLYDQLKKNL